MNAIHISSCFSSKEANPLKYQIFYELHQASHTEERQVKDWEGGWWMDVQMYHQGTDTRNPFDADRLSARDQCVTGIIYYSYKINQQNQSTYHFYFNGRYTVLDWIVDLKEFDLNIVRKHWYGWQTLRITLKLAQCDTSMTWPACHSIGTWKSQVADWCKHRIWGDPVP